MGSTTRKTEMTIIAGSLQGLAGYLVHFTQSASEGAEYAKDIYLYTRKSINPEASLLITALMMSLVLVAIDTVDTI